MVHTVNIYPWVKIFINARQLLIVDGHLRMTSLKTLLAEGLGQPPKAIKFALSSPGSKSLTHDAAIMFLLLSACTFSLCYTVYKLLLNSPFITLPSPSNNLQWLPMVSSLNKVLPAFQGHHDQIWSFHSLSTTALHMCKSQGGSLLFHAHLASCLQFIPQVFYLVISQLIQNFHQPHLVQCSALHFLLIPSPIMPTVLPSLTYNQMLLCVVIQFLIYIILVHSRR